MSMPRRAPPLPHTPAEFLEEYSPPRRQHAHPATALPHTTYACTEGRVMVCGRRNSQVNQVDRRQCSSPLHQSAQEGASVYTASLRKSLLNAPENAAMVARASRGDREAGRVLTTVRVTFVVAACVYTARLLAQSQRFLTAALHGVLLAPFLKACSILSAAAAVLFFSSASALEKRFSRNEVVVCSLHSFSDRRDRRVTVTPRRFPEGRQCPASQLQCKRPRRQSDAPVSTPPPLPDPLCSPCWLLLEQHLRDVGSDKLRASIPPRSRPGHPLCAPRSSPQPQQEPSRPRRSPLPRPR